ncbi:hypothetical protein [Halanaerobium kushneri]|uniref:PH domain-containing protein n=1 Tax=Halanaerobium kushneri TaxID=56779 RepID=A0A1N6SNB5_9FIRM|nr:hypothetical protein [Halanaerobium kushneri]SIQ42615.1 hypothetical protein SAMN05421834_10493 [Halanaerobium kushneri]
MITLKDKIREITGAETDFEVHHIFKEIVTKQTVINEKEEIVDLIFIKRSHIDDRDTESPVESPAKIIVATTYGLIFAEEGFKEITEDYYGYKMKNIYYDKISSAELDICMLQGEFKVVANSSKEPEINISFNTAIYYEEFEKIFEIIRKKRIEFTQ